MKQDQALLKETLQQVGSETFVTLEEKRTRSFMLASLVANDDAD